MPNPKSPTWRRLQRAARRAADPAAGARPPFRVVGATGPYSGFGGFKQKQPPSKSDLVGAYRNAAYVCASMRAEALAGTPLRLYAATDSRKGHKALRCKSAPLGKAQAANFAASPVLSKRLAGVDRVDEVTEHPVLELLDAVNPFMSRTMLLEVTQLNRDVCGQWFWYLVPGAGGVPASVWPLPSWMMTVVPDYSGTDVIGQFLFGGSGGVAPLDRANVLYGRELSLFDHYTQGWGALQANYEHAQIYDKNLDYRDSTLTNRGRPDAMLIPTQEGGEMSIDPAAVQRIQAEYEQGFSRGEAGRLWVPPGGLKLEPVSWSPLDMGELALGKAALHDVARGFKIPIPLIDGESMSRANMDAALLMFARFSLKPACRKLEEYLNSNFLSRWDDRLFLAFDDPVPADKAAEQAENAAYVNKIRTVNEVRASLGEPPVDGGDELFVESSLTPLSRAHEAADLKLNPPAPAPVSTDPEGDPAAPDPAAEDEAFAEGDDVEGGDAGKAMEGEHRRPFRRWDADRL